MPSYLAPGVYVQEEAGGARAIEAVGTSTAGFVGKAPNRKASVNKAIAINNWSQFCREFTQNNEKNSTPLSQAVYGFFIQGGTRCYVVNIGDSTSLTGEGLQRTGLAILETIDEIAIVAAPGFTSASAYDELLTHCEQLQDRVAILDAPQQIPNTHSLTQIALADSTESSTIDDSDDDSDTVVGLRARESTGGYGAYYFPWLVTKDALTKQLIETPPSGYIAGIWARSDAARGVHKAPANEVIRGALNINYSVTRAEQESLNQAGVNCIRLMDKGIKVWGARTLAPSSSEWRYLNVRRLFNMMKESIADNTQWIVFEPNEYSLWKSIRRDISAFLTLLWRDGALMGKTPEDAFFVKCDEETNPPEEIDAGRVTAVIGVAPVKPAEFVIFRISQHHAGTETETES